MPHQINCNPTNHKFDVTTLTVPRGKQVHFKLTQTSTHAFTVEVLNASGQRTSELFGSETFDVVDAVNWKDMEVKSTATVKAAYTIKRVVPPGTTGGKPEEGMTGTITVGPSQP